MEKVHRFSVWVSVSLSILAAWTADARGDLRYQGFVHLPNQQELYVDYTAPAPQRPVVVLLNGLTQDTRHWQRLIQGLSGHGYGILSYDMRGQGRTLLKYAPILNPIPYQQQAKDLQLLLGTLKIHQKVYLAGLSYGGGMAAAFLAAFPQLVESVILMAPYTEPLAAQDQIIKTNMMLYGSLFPGLSAEQLFDHFLRVEVYRTFPMAEPIVLENPYKLEASFRLSQGIRRLIVNNVSQQFPPGSIHLMVAGQDQYIQRRVHDKFWAGVPPAARGSRIIVVDSEHKMIEAVPGFTAGWISHILEGDPRIAHGMEFEGSSMAGEARSGSLRISLPRF